MKRLNASIELSWRCFIVTTLALAHLATPVAVWAQPRVPTIGYLTSGGCPTAANLPLFLEGLQERGYVVGRNLVIECRQTEEVSDEIFRQFAAELVRLNVALIFAVSSAAVRGVRSASQTIPVVA